MPGWDRRDEWMWCVISLCDRALDVPVCAQPLVRLSGLSAAWIPMEPAVWWLQERLLVGGERQASSLLTLHPGS